MAGEKRFGYEWSKFSQITPEYETQFLKWIKPLTKKDFSKIDAIISLGVNRLSIGVQSFNDNELKTLGRIHDSEDAFRSIETIKIAGMKDFSIDLMYGIPGQTMD